MGRQTKAFDSMGISVFYELVGDMRLASIIDQESIFVVLFCRSSIGLKSTFEPL